MGLVSLAVCTYNRGPMLAELIENILENSSGNYELMIIDNNSTDNTQDIVTYFSKSNTHIRYIKEKQVGLSYARNRGIIEARGDIIAFLDDDVIICKDYVSIIEKFFHDHPNEVCVGGKILPLWHVDKPDWFAIDFASITGETVYGEEKRLLKIRECPRGGNMIFKKEVFDIIGNFNVNLGLQGDVLYLGEENELCERIRRMGKQIYYLPEAYVYHKVHVNKINQEYVLQRLSLEGGSIAHWDYETKGFMSRFIRYLFRLSVLLIRDYPLYFFSVISNKNTFVKKCKIKRTKSYLIQMMRMVFAKS